MRPIWAICTKSGQKCSRIGQKKYNHGKKAGVKKQNSDVETVEPLEKQNICHMTTLIQRKYVFSIEKSIPFTKWLEAITRASVKRNFGSFADAKYFAIFDRLNFRWKNLLLQRCRKQSVAPAASIMTGRLRSANNYKHLIFLCGHATYQQLSLAAFYGPLAELEKLGPWTGPRFK